MTPNDDCTAAGLPVRLARRLIGSARALAVTAVQQWAWSTLAVPIAVTVLAVVAYLVHRRGGCGPLGAALDWMLVAVAAVLDPDDTGTPAPRSLCVALSTHSFTGSPAVPSPASSAGAARQPSTAHHPLLPRQDRPSPAS